MRSKRSTSMNWCNTRQACRWLWANWKHYGRYHILSLLACNRPIMMRKSYISWNHQRVLLVYCNNSVSTNVITSCFFFISFRTSCYLVLDLKCGGDLRYYLRKKIVFDEKDVAFYVACLSSALNHIHSMKILHRDVKPENIILDERGYPHLAGRFHVPCTNGLLFRCYL